MQTQKTYDSLRIPMDAPLTVDDVLQQLPPFDQQVFERVPNVGHGRFELGKEIGQGGQAQVAQAKASAPPWGELAVKYVVVGPEFLLSGKPNVWERFKQEARTWHAFEESLHVVKMHYSFANIVFFGSQEMFVLGFVMEFATEGDLSCAIKGGRKVAHGRKGMIKFLSNITSAIKTGHSVDVIHRDVKPQNVLLFPIGGELVPKVMDFGMSISAVDDATPEGLGTPEYLAPELFDTDVFSKEGDIYGLGTLFFEVLAGQRPYLLRETPASMLAKVAAYKQLHQESRLDLSPLDGKADRRMQTLIQRMLSKDPSDRPDISEVAGELDDMLEEELTNARKNPESNPVVRPRYYRWNPAVHATLRHELRYYIIQCKKPKIDTTWLQRSLEGRGLHGFSLYRVLGFYDRILRIWVKQTFSDDLEEIMRDFVTDRQGSVMRFHVREHKNFAGKTIPLECDERKLLKKIITCANPSDRTTEENELLKQKYVLSPLRTERDFPLRFFLTVQLNNEFRPRTLQLFAREFVAALEAETQAKAVSHYLGTGDFHLLLKLRLARFEELRDVLRVFEETSDDLPAQDVSSRSQTFVEVDQDGLIESDDGSIIAELNRLRGEK